MTSKYDPIRQYLQSQTADKLRFTFDQLEEIVGELPYSAGQHREWWSNNENHTHARNGWLAAGWKASQVDMDARELVFIREKDIDRRDIRGDRTVRRFSNNLDIREFPPDLVSVSDIERYAGGIENLLQVVHAIELYISGDIVETELGRMIRKYWPRKD